MTIREKILDRISLIRRGEIDTCRERTIKQEVGLRKMREKVDVALSKLIEKDASTLYGLKAISLFLLSWKSKVGDEIMRVMMIPEPKLIQKLENTVCAECKIVEEISFRIENIVACTEKEDVGLFTQESRKHIDTSSNPFSFRFC